MTPVSGQYTLYSIQYTLLYSTLLYSTLLRPKSCRPPSHYKVALYVVRWNRRCLMQTDSLCTSSALEERVRGRSGTQPECAAVATVTSTLLTTATIGSKWVLQLKKRATTVHTRGLPWRSIIQPTVFVGLFSPRFAGTWKWLLFAKARKARRNSGYKSALWGRLPRSV